MELLLCNVHVRDCNTAFSVAGPRVRNNLPVSLRQTVSAAAFKRQSKTYMYSCAFDSELQITRGFIFLYFIVIIRSKPMFLCVLHTTNLSFDLIWLEIAPFGRSHSSSYWRSIVSMTMFCIISEIKQDIRRKSRFFSYSICIFMKEWLLLI